MVTAAKKITATQSVKVATAVPAKVIKAPVAASSAPQFLPKVAVKPALGLAATPTTKPSAKPKAEKPAKVKKPKLVRDSFTIPKTEYSVLDDLKQRAGKLAHPAKKSELLRAGIKALAAMSDAAFLLAVQAVPTIKTGRPSKG